MTRATVKSHTRHGLRLHPLPLRIMHWTNAVAMIIMIGSGWKIYNDEVLFGWLHFPDWITIGGEAQGALQWHFLGMWILAINGIAYLIYGLVSGRFRRMLLPIRLRELIATVRDALASPPRARRSHPLQRRAAHALCRHHPGRHSAGDLGSRRLEADAVLGADDAVLRLPGRPPGAFPRHGRDRAVSPRARGACAARSEDTGCDGDGRPELDAPPRAVPPAPAPRPTSPDDRRAS